MEVRIQQDIIANVLQGKYASATKHMVDVLKELYDNIPENKRISFGRVYTFQVLSRYLFSSLLKVDVNLYEVGTTLFESSNDFQSKGIALGILSFHGID